MSPFHVTNSISIHPSSVSCFAYVHWHRLLAPWFGSSWHHWHRLLLASVSSLPPSTRSSPPPMLRSLSFSFPGFPFSILPYSTGTSSLSIGHVLGTPLEVSVATSIDETDPLVRRQPGRRTKRCASTRVCDGSAHEWKARKHVRGREADLGDADAAQAPSRTEDKHARQCQSAAEDRPTCLTGAHAIHVVHVGDDDEVRKRGC